jgi:hypothetical protein
MWHTPQFLGRILVSSRDRGPTGSRRSSHRGRSAVFRLEHLEDRTVLSTFMVSNLADSGADSLRQAIIDANANTGADVINFASNLQGTIKLTSGELAITGDLTIYNGPGAKTLAVSGNDLSRVFNVGTGVTATIDGLTITHGLANGSTSDSPSTGGGMLNSGTLNLINDVLSDNQAVGAKGASPGNFQGGALGGAIGTFGSLTVTACQFTNNQALGKSDVNGSSAGAAVAGAIYIAGASSPIVTIKESLFDGNVARGGNRGNRGNTTDSLAGLGHSGAIYNGSTLSVVDSEFRNNQAIGGNDNGGKSFIGLGTGGAIGMGGPNASLTVGLDVSGCTFDHNLAMGGNGNTGSGSFGPNMASGGAIQIAQGSGDISNSTFDHNQAIGGQGADRSGGGSASGGGLFVFALRDNVNVTVSGCTIGYNAAIGGLGGAGGDGGDGLGGGIAIANANHMATLNVDSTTINGNLALGGFTLLGTGGDGLGGGLHKDAASSLVLTSATVKENFALGGFGLAGFGQGIGGGGYAPGTLFSFDDATVIKKNHASTSNNDIFPFP